MLISKLVENYLTTNDLTVVIPRDNTSRDNTSRATEVFNYLINNNINVDALIKYLDIYEINYTSIFKKNDRKLFKKITSYFNLRTTDLLLILKRGGHLNAARKFNYSVYCN